MSLPNHYIIVNPSGDICLVFRAVGSMSTQPFPIMMRDEYGKILPYAEQGSHNHGCLPANLNGSNEIFTRIEISEADFNMIGNLSFFCYFYEKRGRKVLLRPGHIRYKVDPGMWGKKEVYKTDVYDPANLVRCGIAYGGRPIYWIRRGSEKTPEDYPELLKQGCLHPYRYEP